MVNTSLVILTRNEIEGMSVLISKIPFKEVDEYFAVDYKSTDGTVEFLRNNNIPLLKQKNPGRGRAFELASKHAKGEYLIFFSPDGNENPKDIIKLIKASKNNDLVIASRFMKGSRNEEDEKKLKFRKWANQCFSTIANLLWKGKVTDTINGYRIIKKDFYDKLKLNESGFGIEYQMTIRALKLKGRISEIPTIEGDRIGGASTAGSLTTGLRFLKLLFNEIKVGKNF